jgi:hypothetical protein
VTVIWLERGWSSAVGEWLVNSVCVVGVWLVCGEIVAGVWQVKCGW